MRNGSSRGNGQEGGDSVLSKLHVEGLGFDLRRIGLKSDLG